MARGKLKSPVTGPLCQEEQVLWIPGRLAGLNEVVCKNHFSVGRLKKEEQARILARATESGMRPAAPGYWSYLFVEDNRKRDPSNMLFGIKLVEDALQSGGLLGNDGWNHIRGYSIHWTLDQADPGVLVVISSSLTARERLISYHVREARASEEGWNPLEEGRASP